MADGKLSTSQLAKALQRPGREVFDRIRELGLAVKVDGNWQLTDAGNAHGGEYRESKRFGRFIVWPLDLFDAPPDAKRRYLSSTKLGKECGLSANRLNKLLAEIGWIEKAVKGWNVTESGKRVGGIEKEHTQSGVPFVVWPPEILNNSVFNENVALSAGSEVAQDPEPTTAQSQSAESAQTSSAEAQAVAAFREKFPAKYRTMDGHYVRSRGELAIDNWLYHSGLVHAYERKLPIEEDLYCDFYLPNGKVYIEYWGMESDPKYAERQRIKREIYARYNYNLIQLVDADVESLDDVLPRKLLKFGIRAD